MNKKFGSYLQPNWDWRAAGNFMFGGTGSALLLLFALSFWPHPPPLPLGLTALALVGLGLLLVWLEIGRPWRFLHVFFHPQTSWMTREGSVAVLLFATTLAGVALGQPHVLLVAGVLGLVFLYCQARILRAATGIPAWREPTLLPLVIVTGLAEGTALLLIAAQLLHVLRDWQVLLLAALLVLRGMLWTRYRAALDAAQAPGGTRARLAGIHGLFLWGGNALPLALVLVPLVAGPEWLTPLAALLALFAGWHLKFVVVARAADVQGYGIGKLQRGRPALRKPVRRAGDPWQT
jgi:phenylacetyl-CoA:acceptor oxidoreductase subunit 2